MSGLPTVSPMIRGGNKNSVPSCIHLPNSPQTPTLCWPWWGTRILAAYSSPGCALLKGREGNGNPLQCSCLENPRDGGAWWAAIYGVTQSRTRLKRLSSSSSSIKCREHQSHHCLVPPSTAYQAFLAEKTLPSLLGNVLILGQQTAEAEVSQPSLSPSRFSLHGYKHFPQKEG